MILKSFSEITKLIEMLFGDIESRLVRAIYCKGILASESVKREGTNVPVFTISSNKRFNILVSKSSEKDTKRGGVVSEVKEATN